MNKRIGISGSLINLAGVIGFAGNMIWGTNFGSYLFSIFIAFGFVIMMGAFCSFGKEGAKAAGYCAIIFGAMYASVILLVYFAQVTTVRLEPLNEQAVSLLDYQSFGLFFSYDLLGYCLMAVATFFAGLTVQIQKKGDRWLKALLLIHGIFAVACFIMPMLGIFHAGMEGAEWIGKAILVFWCLYFTPVGILSFRYFKNNTSSAED